MSKHSVEYRRKITTDTKCDLCNRKYDVTLICLRCQTLTTLCRYCFRNIYHSPKIYYIDNLESECDIICNICRNKKIDTICY